MRRVINLDRNGQHIQNLRQVVISDELNLRLVEILNPGKVLKANA